MPELFLEKNTKTTKCFILKFDVAFQNLHYELFRRKKGHNYMYSISFLKNEIWVKGYTSFVISCNDIT